MVYLAVIMMMNMELPSMERMRRMFGLSMSRYAFL